MELAIHSPPSEWYVDTHFNDLTWWPLDYPPASAYFAWFTGIISHYYDPESVEPYHSRGYENQNHKNFMRWTVLISELIFFYPAFLLLLKYKLRRFNFEI